MKVNDIYLAFQSAFDLANQNFGLYFSDFQTFYQSLGSNLKGSLTEIANLTGSALPTYEVVSSTQYYAEYGTHQVELTIDGTGIDKLFGGDLTTGIVFFSGITVDYPSDTIHLAISGSGIFTDLDSGAIFGDFTALNFTTPWLDVVATGSISVTGNFVSSPLNIVGSLQELSITYPENNIQLSLLGTIAYFQDAVGNINFNGDVTEVYLSKDGADLTITGDLSCVFDEINGLELFGSNLTTGVISVSSIVFNYPSQEVHLAFSGCVSGLVADLNSGAINGAFDSFHFSTPLLDVVASGLITVVGSSLVSSLDVVGSLESLSITYPGENYFLSIIGYIAYTQDAFGKYHYDGNVTEISVSKNGADLSIKGDLWCSFDEQNGVGVSGSTHEIDLHSLGLSGIVNEIDVQIGDTVIGFIGDIYFGVNGIASGDINNLAVTVNGIYYDASTFNLTDLFVALGGDGLIFLDENGDWSINDAMFPLFSETIGYLLAKIDPIDPTVTSFSPADGAAGVAVGSDIVITFSEMIQAGSGTIAIHAGSYNGPVVESFDVATCGNISITDKTLTINPTADLAHATHYFVTLDNGSVTDLAGNSYAGTTSFDFTTATLFNTAPTFVVGDGTVFTDFGKEDIGRSIAVQADGKILVAGLGNAVSGFFNVSTGTFSYNIGDHAIARYNSDGSLDTTFGVDGKLTTYFGGNSDFANALAVLSDGKILVAGAGYNRNNNTNDFALARYNADGSLDSSFSGNGKVMTDFGGMNDSVNSIKVQSDGKILVAGTSSTVTGVTPSNTDFALARYNADGTLDTTFGVSGKITTDFGGNDNGSSLVLLDDGSILAVGSSAAVVNGVVNQDFAIACYNSDGSLFKKGTLDFGGIEYAQSVVVQSDGKILVAGYSSVVVNGVTNMNFAIARYNGDITLDTGFDGDGKLITDFGGNDNPRSIIVQSDGKILVAGYSFIGNSSTSDFALARYNVDGTPDMTFSDDGKLTMDFGKASDTAYSVMLQADGKILVAGSSSIDGNGDFAVARLNTDGSFDTTFGATNSLNGHPVYTENGTPVVLDSDVRVSDTELAALGNYNGATLVLTRHGGATAEDHFSAIRGGTLGALAEGGLLVAGGVTVGAVTTNSGGMLVLSFNSNATQPLVNSVLQQIAYSNGSTTPEASVQIDWTFSDSNTGSQGTGGAMSAVGTTTVHIAALNDVHDPSVNSAPTFLVGDGTVFTDFGKEDIGRSIAVQADGKILVAGLGNAVSGFLNVSNASLSYTIGDHAIARYNSDGSLDTSFGVNGKLFTYFGGNSDYANGLAVQSDGKILLAGAGYNRGNNTNDFSLARYNVDGSLDSTFSANGKVMTDFGGMNDSGNSIKIQSDGKILVVGISSTVNGVTPSNSDLALARYNADGSLDTTFGVSGKITTDFGGSDVGLGVTVQSDGRILVVGSSATFNGVTQVIDFAFARYNADGVLESKDTIDIGGNDIARSVAMQSDGKILVVGDTTLAGNTDFAIIRSTVDGSAPDTSFGNGGIVITDFGGNDYARSVVLQSNGKILVAGNSSKVGGTSDFAIARYNVDGTLDTTFSDDGKLVMDFGGASDTAYSVTLQADGKILVAGSSFIDGNGDFAVARLNTDGSLDSSFGVINTLNGHPIYTINGSPVVLDSDVRVSDTELAAVGNYNGATLTLIRHGAATAEDHFSAIRGGDLGALAEGGALVAGGIIVGSVTTNSGGMLVLSFNSNATQLLVNSVLQQIAYSNGSTTPDASVQIDWTFSDSNTGSQGTGGAMSAVGTTIVHISAVNDTVNTAPSFLVGDGTVFTDFGKEDIGRSIAVQADGKILVVGLGNAVSGFLNVSTGTLSYTIGDHAIARYNSDGSLDTTFGVEGKLTTYFGGNSDFANALAVQSDGKILLAGAGYNRSNNTNDFSLARYNADGSLDNSFSGNGKLTTDFGGMNDSINSIKVQADGKILVAGNSSTINGVTPSISDFALARYNADGSLDTTFSGDGKLTTDFGGSDSATSVVVLDNGNILAVGSSNVVVGGVSSSDFAFAVYTTDGTLVSNDTIDIGGNDIARSVAVQGDGKILLMGDTTLAGNTDFAITRSTVDGSAPDTSFGNGGIVITDFGGNDYARSVVLQSNGKILVAGNSSKVGGISDFALARYNVDGTLDTTFSDDGKLTMDFGKASDTAYSVMLQADGKILVAGSSSIDGNGDFAVARLNTDGSLDNTFGIRTINTLTASPLYTENNVPVVLDSHAQIYDAELASLGSYSGAMLTLVRHGGATAEDLFSNTGVLGILSEGSALVVDGITVGSVNHNSGGTLVLSFNSSATQPLVNSVLQQIAYSNSSVAPPASVQIDWTFSDGNNGIQGSGGVLNATGSTVIQIIAVNTAAVITGSSSATVAETNSPITASGTLSATDIDNLANFVAQNGVASSNGHGTFSIDTNGLWHYIANSAFDSLSVGATLTDSFTVKTVDDTEQVVTITITGTNDAATFSGQSTGGVTEESGTYTTGGTLTVSDVDSATTITAQTDTAGIYGSFSIGTNGVWSYTADNTKLQVLGGATPTAADTFGITTADGTTHNIVVTLTGTNDAPEFTSGLTGSVDENAATSTVIYTATTTDADTLAAPTYTIGGADASLLTINSNNGEVTLLASADYETKAAYTFDVIANDGFSTSTQAVTVSVNNMNDLPTGSVTVTGIAKQGETLTADITTLGDPDGLGTVHFQWQAGGDDISGATDSTLVLAEAQVNKTITVVASYTDRLNNPESVSSAPSAAVENVNDDPTGQVTITGTEIEGQTLVAGNTLADLDTLGPISYQWYSGSNAISGATSDSYTLTAKEVGTAVTVKANYTDGHGTAESVPSAATAPILGLSSGTVLDGYLSNALVWVDADDDGQFDWTDSIGGNGQWDPGEGESWVITDNTGQFNALVGPGTIRITANPAGGTIDISTGHPFTGSFSAPNGSTVVNPLTTLLVAAEAAGHDAAWVKSILGINQSVDLTTYDPLVAASTSLATPAEVAEAFRIQSTAIEIQNILDIAGAITPGVSSNDVVSEVIDSLIASSASGTLDLLDSTTIRSALDAAAAIAADPSSITSHTDVIASSIAAVNRSTNDVAISNNVSTDIVANMTRIVAAQIVLNNTLELQASQAITQNDNKLVTINSGNIDTLINLAAVKDIFVNHVPLGGVSITGTAKQNQTLTADIAQLTDADGLLALSYQWQSSSDGNIWNSIGAVTSNNSLTLSEAQVGLQVRVIASYTDGVGTPESVTSAPTSSVVNVNDSPTGNVTITGVMTQSETLTVNNTLADPDGPAVLDLHYQWQSDGSDIIGATGATLFLGSALNNTHISVTASYTDGHNYGEQIFSAPTAAIVADTTPPIVLTFNPGTGVASDIVLTFSEAVTGTIELRTESGALVPSHLTGSGTNTITINPDNDLLTGTHYHINFGTTQDLAGNAYTGQGYDFTTAADPYAAQSSSSGSTAAIVGGVAAVGMLAWLFL